MKKNRDLKKLAEQCCRFCCSDGKIDEKKVTGVIKNLKSLPRSQAIFAISEFLKALKKQKGATTLIVESSIPLSKVQLDSIVRKLKSDFIISEVKNIVNPDLLAGFKVRIGDTVSDYSLQDKISQLKGVIAGTL
ncbi:F0F1 ATP synthase subunit delta [Candidatus Microgenomates bacterium]|nr:F0F1 ATP synthase subunit delta [Candidatus Microgenomates bacterium]